MFPKSLKTPQEKQAWFNNKVIGGTYKIQDKHGHRENYRERKKCPYPTYDLHANGYVVKTSNVPCALGKGDYCGMCSRFSKYVKQFGMSKKNYKMHKEKALKSYLTTGLAFGKRRKVNPVSIVNPYRQR